MNDEKFAGKALPDRLLFKKYAKEELVAEIGAQFLCQSSGINRAEVEENAVAYCQNWSRVLKNDPKMIFYAAAKA